MSGRFSLPSHGPPGPIIAPVGAVWIASTGCWPISWSRRSALRGRPKKKMTRIQSPWRRIRLLVAGMTFAGLLGSAERAPAQSAPESCSVASDLARLDLPLSRVAQRLADGESVKIIAIGSSSTAGAGATSRAFSYPSRLEVELRTRFPPTSITVINRGVGGEEAPQMLAR